MMQIIPISDLLQTKTTTPEVEIFYPPMCCPTGMCGPTIDQTLLDLNEMILTLQTQGVSVARFQMTSHPNAFLNNAEVMKIVLEKQMEALPITVVCGGVITLVVFTKLVEVNT